MVNVADSSAWATQARVDAGLVMYGIPAAQARAMDVLDVGCGIGRLSPLIAPDVRSYTGIDISPSMLAEASRRCANLDNARFLVSDGLSVPESARDRDYALAFGWAVFIHCPLVVCRALFRSIRPALEDAGTFRGQLLADPDDLEGIEAAPADTATIQAEMAAVEASTTETERRLIDGTHYQGHKFGFREAKAELESAGFVQVMRWRFDRCHIYFSAVAERVDVGV
jgi:SAM-dependent methyltransferase